MVEDYKKVKEASGDERIETAKKTIMVFPGITKAFIQRQSAVDYLDLATNTNDGTEGSMKVLFEVAVDV